MKRRIGIIGITGSIGTQAVDIVLRHKDRFDVIFATAYSNEKMLTELADKVNAKHRILTSGGMDELVELINKIELDIVIIGAAGTDVLLPAYELAKKGIILAIANKECIVAAGRLITDAAKKHGSSIIPVDSEHSALFQCMAGHNKEQISKLILTASGGSFRNYTFEQLKNVTVEDALKHPNWSMGKKITIDSATMMNKGLELIEARFLFDVNPEMLDVVIHPQSIVHSMVSYKDGSILAHMGLPDMRVPIAYALCYPDRVDTGVAHMDFSKMFELQFYKPESGKYKCLDIALKVLKEDKTSKMITMNAANELAVDFFLNGRINFLDISCIVSNMVNTMNFNEPVCIEDVLQIDKAVRSETEEFILCDFRH